MRPNLEPDSPDVIAGRGGYAEELGARRIYPSAGQGRGRDDAPARPIEVLGEQLPAVRLPHCRPPRCRCRRSPRSPRVSQLTDGLGTTLKLVEVAGVAVLEELARFQVIDAPEPLPAGLDVGFWFSGSSVCSPC